MDHSLFNTSVAPPWTSTRTEVVWNVIRLPPNPWGGERPPRLGGGDEWHSRLKNEMDNWPFKRFYLPWFTDNFCPFGLWQLAAKYSEWLFNGSSTVYGTKVGHPTIRRSLHFETKVVIERKFCFSISEILKEKCRRLKLFKKGLTHVTKKRGLESDSNYL